jgi:1-phosphofructokinase family hexose kinase
MRALVLALNPSIDVEWRVRRVRWEEKNEVLSERRWPGGKGVNLARWLKHLGAQPRLLLPLGGDTGRELAAGLREDGLRTAVVRLREETRANVIVTTEAQGQLRFNPLGPALSHSEWRALLKAAERELRHADLMVLSGSLPRGVPVDAYGQLIRLGRRAGVRALLDCDGAALAAAARAKPFLVKPNVDELARWSGRPLKTRSSVLDAASSLAGVTRGLVFVSLGATGAMLFGNEPRVAVSAMAPRVRVRNTVGAGDALLAAVAQQVMSGESFEQWVRWGVATGTAATSRPAGELPTRAVIRKIALRVRMI